MVLLKIDQPILYHIQLPHLLGCANLKSAAKGIYQIKARSTSSSSSEPAE